MFFLVAGCIIAVFVILSTINSSNKKKRKIIEQLRARWGKPKTGPFNFDRIERYATLSGGNGYHRVSGQTMNDIDFFELFSFIDRTNSKIGQQFLFNHLLYPSNDQKTLDILNQRALLFSKDQQLREDVQKELIRLSNTDAYFVTSLLEKKLLQRPPWLNLIYVSIFSVVALVALSFVNPIFLILLLLPLTINSFVHYWNKTNTFLFLRSFPQLSLLINVCDNLHGKNLYYNVEGVKESITALKPFLWKMGFVSMSPGGTVKDELGQVATYLVELLRGFLLIEVVMLFELIKELETKRDAIQVLFDYVGNVDTALSVACLRAGDLKTCKPEFTPPMKELRVKKIYHPLITNCVKNDLHVKGKSVLITGSNMSGKTTFLRTVAINLLLAQTVYTCFADEFQSPMLRPFSSIRIDDSTLEGRSYYYQEVHTMGTLINEAYSPFQNLFLLDEVFKGTNTIERIAAAKATLSFLNQGANLVIVSTHDLELPSMLQEQFDLYHFSESIEKGQLHFDHKIKPGPLLTGNAIKILEMSNYPEKIINEAKELSLTLSSS
jgi:DNA mismatch repair ATPase MutS